MHPGPPFPDVIPFQRVDVALRTARRDCPRHRWQRHAALPQVPLQVRDELPGQNETLLMVYKTFRWNKYIEWITYRETGLMLVILLSMI